MIKTNMNIKKFKRGDRLQLTLIELSVGESVRVPYRFYSENSQRATLSQLRAGGTDYEMDSTSAVASIITRTK